MGTRDARLAVSRRGFLGVAGAAVAVVVAGPGVAWSATGDAFDQLRQRWADGLTGGAFDASDPVFAAAVGGVDASAQAAWDKVDRSAGRSSVFTDVPFATSANVTTTYNRLRAMATAYATTGAGLRGNGDLGADIAAGLELTNQRIYNTGQSEFGNWWDWEIGSPQALNDTCVLAYDQLSADDISSYAAAVDHFVPSPARMINQSIVSTGANRTDLCRVIAIRGILGRDAGQLGTARDALSDVFTYVTASDGFYRDGSFVQHTYVPYTGTYGVTLISGVGRLVALLAGSSWAITDPNVSIIFDAVEKTYAPVVQDDVMMDFVRGRSVSREAETDHGDGHSAVEDILLLAQGAPAADAGHWRGICKGWVTRDHYDNYFAGASVPRIALVKPVIDDPSVAAVPEPAAHTQFPDMDRVVHRRPGWAYAIAMASQRISYYECGNDENLHGFHTGDGMTYLYGTDQGQFTDAFWPTVDPYRLPGITVDTQRLPDAAGGQWANPRPSTSWAGGASLSGHYGAVGMDLAPLQSPLRGKKSWFCLDDRIVALGAGITAAGGRTIETVLENRNLHSDGTNTFTVDGRQQPAQPGWQATFTDAGWAHLAGVAGYTLLDGAPLHALREDRTGAWTDINKLAGAATPTPITRRYHTLWLDHGTNPQQANYAYTVLPGATAQETALAAREPGVRVLANTAQAQAIDVPGLGLTMANFWAAGSAAGITVSGPASVVMREQGGTLTVAVSDPTHLQTPLRVGIDRPAYQNGTGDPTVVVEHLRPAISFVVDMQGTHGATHTAEFSHGPASGERRLTVSTSVPTADAYVRDGSYAGTNYGSATDLFVKTAPGTGFNRRTFLRFAPVPNRPVDRAVLWVSAFTADSGGTTTQIAAHAFGGSFQEATVTWNTQPPLGARLAQAAVTNIQDWISFDVTGYVQQTAASGSPIDVALAEDADGLAVIMPSREASQAPFLEVVAEE